MTLFLASVRDAGEAELALAAGADIIDLKDPSRGALGALAPEAVAACTKAVAGRAPMSATIGDLPMHPARIRDAVRATAETGVDYVKLGLSPGGDAQACLHALEEEARRVRLVLVAFADAMPAFDTAAAAARIGAHGVMLDTMRKDAGSLLDHADRGQLAQFVDAAKAEGLAVGLAGSLRACHVPDLLRLEPDLLGFRGALCRDGVRGRSLDADACVGIRALIPRAAASAKTGLAA
jgi:(5-formylfuran-3-yl)methyl phosphate synthase